MRLRVSLLLLVVLLVPTSIRGQVDLTKPPTDFELTMDSFTVYQKGPTLKIELSGWVMERGSKANKTFVYEVDLEANMVTKGGVSHPMDWRLIDKIGKAIYPLQRAASEGVVSWHISNEKLIDSMADKKSP